MMHKVIETALLKIIPQDDPKQAIRLRRFFMAFVIYILAGSLAYISYRSNIMEWEGIYACLIGIPLINVILYIIFRTGLNLRMPDPSLTSIQMCLAILVVTYGIYYANEARALLLMVYVPIFLFGIFRLNTRQFLFISVFTLLAYGADVALLYVFHPQRVNLKIEYFQWSVMSIVLIIFSFMGGHLSSIRRNLSTNRVELEKSVSLIKAEVEERKETEEALSQSEEKYRTILENIEDGYYEVDIAGNLTFFNDSMCRIWGYPKEELIGMNNRQYTDKENAKKLFQTFNEVYRTGNPAKVFNWQIIRKDGTKRFIEASVSLLKDSSSKKLGFRGITRDVTERKQTEETLLQSEEKYRSILEDMQESYFEVDLAGNVTFVNDSACVLLGYSRAEMMGMNNRQFTDKEYAKKLFQTFNEVYETGDPTKEFDWQIIRRDGTKRYVEVSVSLQKSSSGKPIGFRGVSRDITERKQAEEDKRILEERLQHADKMEAIGTLAGGIAHDFNNLLMGIQGNVSLSLMNLDPSNPNYEKLTRIEEQVQSGAKLARQLLGFARGGRYEVKPADMNDIIEKSSSMFGRTKKEITIHKKYKKDLSAVEVDRGQMEQVFMNLYVNAWQAMPAGGNIYLETENVLLDDQQALTYTVKPGRYIKISVTDTGAGMDEKTKERIFDPFFTTKAMGRGTGLGLATVYGIIKGHKGMINVYSELGKGTTFTIYLPASEMEVVKEKAGNGKVVRGKGTIMLVDDEKMVLETNKEMLEFLGYKVYAFDSGQEAIAIYMGKSNKIDLVILDMIMPGISGGETFDRLREINPGVRVLLSSGYSLTGEAETIMDRGCRGFLQKPFQLEQLSQKVREMLD